MSSILLFDLDGTLVDTGGAGRRAIEHAVALEVGGAEGVLDFYFGGLTDPAIIRRGLRNGGQPADEEQLRRVCERYLERLAEELIARPGYRVLDGVVTLLEALAARAARQQDLLAVGLGTGNLARGAELKLRPADLWRFFSFGGFGSDSEDRPELLRVGAARGAAALGRPREQCRVIVIGDTPLDVAAARAIGAECVAVASGQHSPAELHAAGAHRVIETLASLAVEDLLAGRP